MSPLAAMASQLLHSMSGSGSMCAPRSIGLKNLCPDARERLRVVQGDWYKTLRKIQFRKRETTGTVCRLRGNQGAFVDGPASRSTSEIYRRKELQPCRSMMNEDDNRVGRGIGTGEQCGAGWETTSEWLYVKRSICDGEIVEHSGSVIILGDVKHGGYVSAGGDVIVLGRLQGTVQAGRSGNQSAEVFTAFQGSGTIKLGDEATLQLAGTGSYSAHVATLAPDGRILIRPAIGEPYQGHNVFPEERPSLTKRSRENVDAANADFNSATQPKATQNKRPAQVALFTGVYISVAGLVLFAFPKLFGIFFDLQSVSLGWIQVGAVLAVVFGVYYIGTAVGDMRQIQGAQAFYYSTIVGRTLLFVSFTWLVVVGAVPSALLLVGFVNLVGALLMWRALLENRDRVGHN